MSGDVFGNGMLLSPHIRLVAAFDHRHVFLDPNPDPATSFAERARMFALERSSWADYDPAAISAGGGVYPRTAKTIPLSPAVQAALGIDAHALPPAELIRAILQAPVDLLYNGGIGTYVKAARETHLQVGDRANDAVRVNGTDLRCKVIGEGGNLGCTQFGRIEFAQRGGRINTDAIDNSAGVDCSDHEVNIKILLETVVSDGEMTEAAQCAARGDDRRSRAARAARQLLPDAGAVDRRPLCGRAARRRGAPDALARTRGPPEPRDRIPADRRRSRRTAGREARPHVAGTRGAARVQQDVAVRRAARIRRARGSAGGRDARRLLPEAAAAALQRTDAPPSAAPRDPRDAPDQRAREPRRLRVRAPADGGDRREARRHRAGVHHGARRVRPRCGVARYRRARQPRRRRRAGAHVRRRRAAAGTRGAVVPAASAVRRGGRWWRHRADRALPRRGGAACTAIAVAAAGRRSRGAVRTAARAG